MAWLKTLPFDNHELVEALDPETRRKARLLGLAGPVGMLAAGVTFFLVLLGADPYGIRALAAAVAVFYSTAGALAGIVVRSNRHTLAGVYAGAAAGGAFYVIISPLWARFFPLSMLALFPALLSASAIFGAFFGWADREKGRVGKGAAAAVLATLWFFAALALCFPIWLPALAVVAAPMALDIVDAAGCGVVILAGLAFLVYAATRGFFLEMKRGYDLKARAAEAPLKKTGPAATSAQKGDTDEDNS